MDSNTTVNVSASNVDMDFLDDENQLGDEEDSSITEVFTSSAVQVLDEVTNLTTTAVSFTVSFDATTTQPLGLLTTGNTSKCEPVGASSPVWLQHLQTLVTCAKTYKLHKWYRCEIVHSEVKWLSLGNLDSVFEIWANA